MMDLGPTPQVKPLAKYVSHVDVPIKSSHPCPAKKSNHIIKSHFHDNFDFINHSTGKHDRGPLNFLTLFSFSLIKSLSVDLILVQNIIIQW